MREHEEVHRSSRADACHAAGECKKLARKLRWLGEEKDALRLEETLVRIAPDEFVLLLIEDTD